MVRMRLAVLLIICMQLVGIINAQETNQILDEGLLLFRLEKANQQTREHYKSRQSNTSEDIDFISYVSEYNEFTTVVYDENYTDEIIARYTLDSLTLVPKEIYSNKIEPTQLELDLIAIKQDTKSRTSNRNDSY
ncbi:MAG: hypothetical protein MI922_01610, partial [Bacteroidales bacterium]|nr:hypothetical protein [Bacteroidales bacterium]